MLQHELAWGFVAAKLSKDECHAFLGLAGLRSADSPLPLSRYGTLAAACFFAARASPFHPQLARRDRSAGTSMLRLLPDEDRALFVHEALHLLETKSRTGAVFLAKQLNPMRNEAPIQYIIQQATRLGSALRAGLSPATLWERIRNARRVALDAEYGTPSAVVSPLHAVIAALGHMIMGPSTSRAIGENILLQCLQLVGSLQRLAKSQSQAEVARQHAIGESEQVQPASPAHIEALAKMLHVATKAS